MHRAPRQLDDIRTRFPGRLEVLLRRHLPQTDLLEIVSFVCNVQSSNLAIHEPLSSVTGNGIVDKG